jgi:plastocyanin
MSLSQSRHEANGQPAGHTYISTKGRAGGAARWLLTAVLMIAVAGCGSSGGSAAAAPISTSGSSGSSGSGGPSASEVSAILVGDNYYLPQVDTVAVGTTITWTWGGGQYAQDQSEHSVTFADGQTSPTQMTGTYSRTFTSAGTYNYQCLVHGSAMTGVIVVQ